MPKKIYDKEQTGSYSKSTSSAFAYRGSQSKYSKDPTLSEADEFSETSKSNRDGSKSTSRDGFFYLMLSTLIEPFRIIGKAFYGWLDIEDIEDSVDDVDNWMTRRLEKLNNQH